MVRGCGGDRDPTKRPVMGAALGRLADYSVLTNDNPRTEAPEKIVREMERGLVEQGRGTAYEVCLDRRRAIGLAIAKAGRGDAVVIAGKGHETYQEVMGQRHRFDDREIAREVCREAMSRRTGEK